MFSMHRFAAALMVMVGVATAAPACAAQGHFSSYQLDYRDFERRAYENGYREGLEHGEHDARRGRDFAYAHDNDYRDADRGYRRQYGSIETYRRVFRQGYVEGYTEGYRGSHGAWRNDYPRRNYPVYRGSQADPNVYRRSGGYDSPAAQIGHRDGNEAGRKDARGQERYDPRRAKRYREGDHDYDRRYGSREQYKQEYRAAFQEGYAQGFGGYRR